MVASAKEVPKYNKDATATRVVYLFLFITATISWPNNHFDPKEKNTMQSEKVNYSVKYASASHPVSDTNLSAAVCQWVPKFFVNSKASSAQALFNLNTSSFTQDSAEKEFKRIAFNKQSFVGIQEVISIILAQEKHKVSRNEVT